MELRGEGRRVRMTLLRDCERFISVYRFPVTKQQNRSSGSLAVSSRYGCALLPTTQIITNPIAGCYKPRRDCNQICTPYPLSPSVCEGLEISMISSLIVITFSRYGVRSSEAVHPIRKKKKIPRNIFLCYQ